MDFFAGIQPPNERSVVNVDDLLKHSLNEAITALCTRSKKQNIPSDSDYTNSGHIILSYYLIFWDCIMTMLFNAYHLLTLFSFLVRPRHIPSGGSF